MAIDDAQDQLRWRAFRTARTVEGLAWLFGVVGVGLGVLIAVERDANVVCDGTCPWLDEHPSLWPGLAIAFAAVFQAAIVVMLATYIQHRTAEHGRP